LRGNYNLNICAPDNNYYFLAGAGVGATSLAPEAHSTHPEVLTVPQDLLAQEEPQESPLRILPSKILPRLLPQLRPPKRRPPQPAVASTVKTRARPNTKAGRINFFMVIPFDKAGKIS
jgi:hypothetical protein